MSFRLAQLAGRTPLPKSKGGHTTQAVFQAICSHAHDKTHECRVGVARFAWETGRSERQVQRALADLVAMGALSRRKGGQHHVDIFTVNVRWLEAQHASSEASFKVVKNARRSASADGPEVTSMSPLSNSRGDISDTPEVTPMSPKESSRKEEARARVGTGGAAPPKPAVPLGSARARTPPATQHKPSADFSDVEDARTRKRASLRSGDGTRLEARTTPQPARAQSFDIEDWTPTPDQLERLRKVRPDLDVERVDEQVVAFRVWARGKDLRFRDAEECVRRAAGFVRLTHTPKVNRQPHEGSARSKRAASAKPKCKSKPMKQKGASAPVKQAPPAELTPSGRRELEQLAKDAGCRLNIISASKVEVYVDDPTTKGTSLMVVPSLQAVSFLRARALDRRNEEWRQFMQLVEQAGCRVTGSPGVLTLIHVETDAVLGSRLTRAQATAVLGEHLNGGARGPLR